MAPSGRARDHVVVEHPLQPFDARNFEAGALAPDRTWSFDPVAADGARALRGERRAAVAFLDGRLVAADEPLVEKSYGDSFEGTTLEEVLARLRVGRLVVAGAQTDMCIRSTLHGALVRGYDAVLVSDAHTTEDLSAWGAPPPELVVAHTNLYWGDQRAPGRTAGTQTTDEVVLTPGT